MNYGKPQSETKITQKEIIEVSRERFEPTHSGDITYRLPLFFKNIH
jgi:hypothetical protein